MISIIICSRNNIIDTELQENISTTIGTDFEIVCIDNSKNEYSMCSAYNEGVRRAKGEYLCFMHEDIAFLSEDWGKIAISQFLDDKVGMLGVIGTTYYDRSMNYWCHTSFFVGHNWANGEERAFSNDKEPVDVVAVDGLWMFSTRKIFEEIRWDDATFKGFNMYDMDLSMQIMKSGRRIKVVPEIHIDHRSDGNFSESFYNTSKLFHDKWDSILPITSKHTLEYCRDRQMSYILHEFAGMDMYSKKFEKEMQVQYKHNQELAFHNSQLETYIKELLNIRFVKIALKINAIYLKVKRHLVPQHH